MKVTPPPSPTPGDAGPPGNRSEASQLLDKLQLELGGSTMARVMAKLESAGNQKEHLLLELNGQTLKVVSDAKLQPGQQVRIQRAGNQLRLMEVLSPQTPETLPLQELTRALAARLPFQHRLDTGLGQLLALLKGATNQRGATSPPQSAGSRPGPAELTTHPRLPVKAAPVRDAIEKLAQMLPRAETLARIAEQPHPEQAVKALLRQSGHFSEPQLNARLLPEALRGALSPESKTALPPDFKLALFDVVRALSANQDPAAIITTLKAIQPAVSHDLVQAPLQFPFLPAPSHQSVAQHQENLDTGQLLKLLAGMLNRVNVNQLHAQSISQQQGPDAAPAHAWLVEIPWLNPQEQPRTLQLRMERREQDDSSRGRRRKRVMQWRLNLSLELDGLGPVHFELALQDRRLDTRMWAEKASTLRLLEKESSRLRGRLDRLGLASVSLECRKGQPPQRPTQLEQRLVDIKA